MKFTCPYQNLQNHLFEIRNPWDYFNHLQKCHIINEEILKSKKNSYFVCPFCLQLFEHLSERDSHMEACNICNFKPLFKDISLPIMIGKEGAKQLKAIIEFYKEMITSHEEEPQQSVVPQPLPEEHPKPKINQLNPVSVNIQKPKRKLKIDLMNNRQSLIGACFKIHQDYTLELINNQFDIRVPSSSLLKFLQDRGIELTSKNYKQYLICEFMEDNEMHEKNTNNTYVKINTVNQQSTVWVLVSEESCPLKDISFNQPWNMLSIQTQMRLSELKDLNMGETMLNDLLEEKQKLEELTKQAVERYHYLKNEQLEIDTQIKIRRRRIEKLDLEQNEMKQKLIKITRESQSIQEQADQIAQQKLIKAKEDLEKHFKQQMEIEKKKLGNSDISTKLEKSRKKRDGMGKQINDLLAKKKSAMLQLDQLNLQVQEDLSSFEKEQDRMRNGVEQIMSREQVINQQLCIKCRQQNREIIQKPCQHFLFCEKCFNYEFENNRYFNCPLADIGQCKEGTLEKKYKKVKI